MKGCHGGSSKSVILVARKESYVCNVYVVASLMMKLAIQFTSLLWAGLDRTSRSVLHGVYTYTHIHIYPNSHPSSSTVPTI